ncbi:hypothetical protein CRE_08331 [Caenorhabditis remanei]|uniref:Uncharacterized protein n=1 Tax=Caenorhabditis remanei TaxID=31234 RepID=E3MPG1_CAERE|nr:hypothetical protein CRE_08331 [Caenorhabditis remanei]
MICCFRLLNSRRRRNVSTRTIKFLQEDGCSQIQRIGSKIVRCRCQGGETEELRQEMNFGYNDEGIPDGKFVVTEELTLEEAANNNVVSVIKMARRFEYRKPSILPNFLVRNDVLLNEPSTIQCYNDFVLKSESPTEWESPRTQSDFYGIINFIGCNAGSFEHLEQFINDDRSTAKIRTLFITQAAISKEFREKITSLGRKDEVGFDKEELV